jgi:general secretion pathway protein B
MSYILDALRRADAERGRGGVPSIHSQQPITPIEADDDARRPATRRLTWGGAALALVGLGAGLGWWLLRPQPAPVVASAPLPVTPMGAMPHGAPPSPNPPGPMVPVPGPVAPAVAPPPNASLGSSLPAPPDATRPPIAEAARLPSRARAARTAPEPARDAIETRALANEPRAADAGRPDRAASAAAASASDRVYAVRDLPDDVRRALPAITVAGSTWSNDPTSRMLMIGGQIYHEGDSVAQGVALERIQPHAAVFAFRGYRYQLTF